MWVRVAGPAQAPVPTLAFTVGSHCSSQSTRQSHWNGFPRRSLGQEAERGCVTWLPAPGRSHSPHNLPCPEEGSMVDGKHVKPFVAGLMGPRHSGHCCLSPCNYFQGPALHPAHTPQSLTRESGSPGLGTGTWGDSRGGYWPDSCGERKSISPFIDSCTPGPRGVGACWGDCGGMSLRHAQVCEGAESTEGVLRDGANLIVLDEAVEEKGQ